MRMMGILDKIGNSEKIEDLEGMEGAGQSRVVEDISRPSKNR